MQFICRIGTQDGRVLEEVFSASDEAALRSDLGKRGYHLFEVKRRGAAPQLGIPALLRGGRRGRIPVQEFLVFNQELAALLNGKVGSVVKLEGLWQPGPEKTAGTLSDCPAGGTDAAIRYISCTGGGAA